jgi:hypothetical protein
LSENEIHIISRNNDFVLKMGVKGLYSCLKSYSIPVRLENEPPCKLALDAYPFLYKFREDIDACLTLFKKLITAGHTLCIYIDGTPPKEKMAELTQRKQQKEAAYQQAKALKSFLADETKSAELNEEARAILEKQVNTFEIESWSLRKEVRESFVRRCKEELNIPIVLCEGEADTDLVRASLKGDANIVIANDMDLFVGGVERLWILGKTSQDPLFIEFCRSAISSQLGIHPKAWADVALLTGYEKTASLKRCSAQQAIEWMRYYGCIENMYHRRKDVFKDTLLDDYKKARDFFAV